MTDNPDDSLDKAPEDDIAQSVQNLTSLKESFIQQIEIIEGFSIPKDLQIPYVEIPNNSDEPQSLPLFKNEVAYRSFLTVLVFVTKHYYQRGIQVIDSSISKPLEIDSNDANAIRIAATDTTRYGTMQSSLNSYLFIPSVPDFISGEGISANREHIERYVRTLINLLNPDLFRAIDNVELGTNENIRGFLESLHKGISMETAFDPDKFSEFLTVLDQYGIEEKITKAKFCLLLNYIYNESSQAQKPIYPIVKDVYKNPAAFVGVLYGILSEIIFDDIFPNSEA